MYYETVDIEAAFDELESVRAQYFASNDFLLLNIPPN